MPTNIDFKTRRELCARWAKRAEEVGEIQNPGSCENCGKETQALDKHHPDYTRPTNVVWWCRKCHNNFHQPEGPRGPKVQAAFHDDEYPFGSLPIDAHIQSIVNGDFEKWRKSREVITHRTPIEEVLDRVKRTPKIVAPVPDPYPRVERDLKKLERAWEEEQAKIPFWDKYQVIEKPSPGYVNHIGSRNRLQLTRSKRNG